MSLELSADEKRQLTYERQRAVRNAWKNEKELVKNGCGTRDWSVKEQKELLERGSVSGYEGHHMKSVSVYPEQAGNYQNIQFLTEEEHLYGAHEGDYHNSTNGYYNTYTKTMENFEGDELRSIEEISLSETFINNTSDELSEARNQYCADNECVTDTSVTKDDTSVLAEQYTNNDNTLDSSTSESHGMGM